MSAGPQKVLPWEGHDNETQAAVLHNGALRRKNQDLETENMRLKRILRENGISWSGISATFNHQTQMQASGHRTRSLTGATQTFNPPLPIEIILRILKYALTSPKPIIDPLSVTKKENLTQKERNASNQIAIHFLATSKAMHTEGQRLLWTNNSFVFTTPEALRNFAELSITYRKQIKHITIRCIAQYYDDEHRPRQHKLPRLYHDSFKKDAQLKTQVRLPPVGLQRGGFRSYSWTQISDFLKALRTPFGTVMDEKKTRPRLLPALESMRLELINFAPDLLQYTGTEFHDLASHEFGSTLNELQVTGVPDDDVGFKLQAELTGLLKDGGLYLYGEPAFVQMKNGLKPLTGRAWCSRVVRSWRLERPNAKNGEGSNPNRIKSKVAAVPEETPPSHIHDSLSDKVIWKQVPDTRDGEERHWVPFGRESGYPKLPYDDLFDSDDESICPCCGESHPGSSFLALVADEDEEDFDDHFY